MLLVKTAGCYYASPVKLLKMLRFREPIRYLISVYTFTLRFVFAVCDHPLPPWPNRQLIDVSCKEMTEVF